MPLLLLLVLGGVAWAASAGRQASGKPSRPELEKFAGSCPLDPSLSPESVAIVRAQFGSALAGQIDPGTLFRSGDELERQGFPMAANCARQLALGLSKK